MQNWKNSSGEDENISEMADSQILRIICLVPYGYGWSSETVLGCIGDLYAEANRRDLIYGFKAWLLEKYSIMMWRKIKRYEKSQKPLRWHTPWWVRRLVYSVTLKQDIGA